MTDEDKNGGGGCDGVMITDRWEQTSLNWNVIKEKLLKDKIQWINDPLTLSSYTLYSIYGLLLDPLVP